MHGLDAMKEDFIEEEFSQEQAEAYLEQHPFLPESPTVHEILNYNKCKAVIDNQFYLKDKDGNFVGFNADTLNHIDAHINDSEIRLMPNNPSKNQQERVIKNHEILLIQEIVHNKPPAYSIGFKNQESKYIKIPFELSIEKLELKFNGRIYNRSRSEILYNQLTSFVRANNGYTNKQCITQRFEKNTENIIRAAQAEGKDVIDYLIDTPEKPADIKIQSVFHGDKAAQTFTLKTLLQGVLVDQKGNRLTGNARKDFLRSKGTGAILLYINGENTNEIGLNINFPFGNKPRIPSDDNMNAVKVIFNSKGTFHSFPCKVNINEFPEFTKTTFSAKKSKEESGASSVKESKCTPRMLELREIIRNNKLPKSSTQNVSEPLPTLDKLSYLREIIRQNKHSLPEAHHTESNILESPEKRKTPDVAENLPTSKRPCSEVNKNEILHPHRNVETRFFAAHKLANYPPTSPASKTFTPYFDSKKAFSFFNSTTTQEGEGRANASMQAKSRTQNEAEISQISRQTRARQNTAQQDKTSAAFHSIDDGDEINLQKTEKRKIDELSPDLPHNNRPSFERANNKAEMPTTRNVETRLSSRQKSATLSATCPPKTYTPHFDTKKSPNFFNSTTKQDATRKKNDSVQPKFQPQKGTQTNQKVNQAQVAKRQVVVNQTQQRTQQQATQQRAQQQATQQRVQQQATQQRVQQQATQQRAQQQVAQQRAQQQAAQQRAAQLRAQQQAAQQRAAQLRAQQQAAQQRAAQERAAREAQQRAAREQAAREAQRAAQARAAQQQLAAQRAAEQSRLAYQRASWQRAATTAAAFRFRR